MRDKVLIITGILPVKDIAHKENENDILLVTESKITSSYKNIKFDYLFVFPYANKVLSIFSKRWKSYYKLGEKNTVFIGDKVIHVFPLILLPFKTSLRNLFIRIFLLFNRRKIEAIFKKVNPTVLHAQSADGSAYLAKLLSEKYNIPYYVTLRGINKYMDKYVYNNLKDAAKLIAISPIQQRFNPIEFKPKTLFIPHGVDDIFFTNKTRSYNSHVKIISVARLIKLKNFDLLIKVLSKFERDFKLDIYGDGPERDRLKETIFHYGLQDKITLKGYVEYSKLPSIYPNYDLFVMISFPETLGRVYFEAMASNLPVVGSMNTGVDGLVNNYREGVLFDPFAQNFSYEFLDFLTKYSQDEELRNLMKSNARVLAEKFTWEEVVLKYGDLYSQTYE